MLFWWPRGAGESIRIKPKISITQTKTKANRLQKCVRASAWTNPLGDCAVSIWFFLHKINIRTEPRNRDIRALALPWMVHYTCSLSLEQSCCKSLSSVKWCCNSYGLSAARGLHWCVFGNTQKDDFPNSTLVPMIMDFAMGGSSWVASGPCTSFFSAEALAATRTPTQMKTSAIKRRTCACKPFWVLVDCFAAALVCFKISNRRNYERWMNTIRAHQITDNRILHSRVSL